MLLGGLRNVWPSQLRLLRRMSSSTGVCCILAYRFSLLIVSGQWILRILRKHGLIKDWIFFIDALVVRHVSAPYNNTDLTFELNKRALVDVPIFLEHQTFFSMLNADRALPILVFTSASVPHLSITLPK